MTNGVVALLDEDTTGKIESIWKEFQASFGVHGVSMTPIPHFSFHVAESYDAIQTIPIIETSTQQIAPFTVRTAGLGIFTGVMPVVHLAVVRNTRVMELHAHLREHLTPLAAGVETYYHPDHWQPHITIAQGDIPPEKLPQVIAMLQARDFNWTIEINRIGFIASQGTGKVHELAQAFPLQG
jgi:2'-5' RNA ligase